jgi:hypothetical protein
MNFDRWGAVIHEIGFVSTLFFSFGMTTFVGHEELE